MNTKIIGARGERIAADHLKNKGYKILGKNFFLRAEGGPKIAEIDIIAKKHDCFVFVEVKTIKQYKELHYLPQDKVDERKLWKISKAAETWLVKNRIPLDSKWQIDVIAIELLDDTRPTLFQNLLGPKFKLSHFENVVTN